MNNNYIGLKLFKSLVEPLFWIGMMLAIFSVSGYIPVINEVFNILHKGRIITSGINLRRLIGILNGPVDLFSSEHIIFRTSSLEICATIKLN